MPPPQMTPDEWVPIALECIGDRGFSAFRLTDLADQLSLTPAAFYDICPSRSALLGHIIDFADRRTLADYGGPLTHTTGSERFLDIVLCRLDALNPYKKGIAAIYNDMTALSLDDKTLLPFLTMRGFESLTFLLTHAGITPGPLQQALLAPFLAFLLHDPLTVWFHDESTALEPTMAALDCAIQKIPAWFWQGS